MSTPNETGDSPNPQMPKRIELQAHFIAGPPSASVTLRVIQADKVKVEDAPSPVYLRLRSGDIECYSRVLISVEGAWHEITVDSLPNES